MSRAPPPRGQAPVSRDVVDVVRKKISAPAGPPPAGMNKNFSAPRAVSSSAGNYRGKENYYDDEEDDGNGRYDDRNDKYSRGNKPSRSNYEEDYYDDNDRQLPPRAAQYRDDRRGGNDYYQDDERNDNRIYSSRNSSQDSRHRDYEYEGHEDDRYNNQPYRNTRDAGPRSNTSRQSDYYDDGHDPYYNDNRQSNSRPSSRGQSRPTGPPSRRGYEDEFDDYDQQPKPNSRGGRYQEEEIDEYNHSSNDRYGHDDRNENNHPPRGGNSLRSSRDQDLRSNGHGIASNNYRNARDAGRDRYDQEDTQAYEEEDYDARGPRGGSRGPGGGRQYEEQTDDYDGYPGQNKNTRNDGMNTSKPMAQPPSLLNPTNANPKNPVPSNAAALNGHGATLGPNSRHPISPALLAGMSGADPSLDKSAAVGAQAIAGTAANPAAVAAAGKKLIIFDFRPILKSTYRELKSFVMAPAASGVIVRCYIERSRSVLSQQYSLCADLEGKNIVVSDNLNVSHFVAFV
jgi:hypothetical protein